MNMVSLLTLGLVLNFNLSSPKSGSLVIGVIVATICAVSIGWLYGRANVKQAILLKRKLNHDLHD